ncbi:hypothetical protein J6590_034089, partial [Homalodisca vitripennis]
MAYKYRNFHRTVRNPILHYNVKENEEVGRKLNAWSGGNMDAKDGLTDEISLIDGDS